MSVILGNLNVQSLKNLEPEASVQAKSVGGIIRAIFEFRDRFISFEFLFGRRGILGLFRPDSVSS